MKITLRKANIVQNSINDIIKGINIVTEITVNEFQDPEAEIASVAQELKKNVGRRDRLISALYEIRKSVSTLNQTTGIDFKLADVANLEKNIQFYNELSGKTLRESTEVLAGKLDKIRNSKSEHQRNIYGNFNDTVTTSVLTRLDLDMFKKIVADLKKQKQKLQDEILEINVRSEIQLSEGTVSTLVEEDIV